MNAKEVNLNTYKDREHEYEMLNGQLQKEKDELNRQYKQLQDEFDRKINGILLKQQAVNKLHEIMNRKDPRGRRARVNQSFQCRLEKEREGFEEVAARIKFRKGEI
ncbi:hypothetical protein NQ317_000408 [Molorchus minor]|uniref:non-specific serine/threonine protein kinase n=1 Tax=Molorchus minor TaxID=1323400 RepID=A0ABQ9JAT0_9CUCU|nr:hypothetical protein NQ317_000408 [Molorchus minor]